MAYTKTNWQDLPNTTTPVNSSNLNKMENQLAVVDSALLLKGSLSNNSNLNDITTTGIYSTMANTLTNAPISSYQWGYLVVINQNAVIQQWFIKPVGSVFYAREYSGNPSVWSVWRPLNQDRQWSSATINSNSLSGGSVKYFKQGNVVTVNITDLASSSDITTHGTILASGLPGAIENTLFCLDRYTPDTSASSNCRVAINSAGELYLHYDHFYSGGKQYYGHITYLSS